MRHLSRADALLRLLTALVLSSAGFLNAACSGTLTDDDPSDPGSDTDPSNDDDDDGDGDPGDGVMPPAPTSGTVRLVLHPGPTITAGQPTLVTFGAPFPAGAVTDPAQISAHTLSGEELAIRADSILPWRAWPGRSDYTESVRSAQITVEVTFDTVTSMEIDLSWGAAATRTLSAQPAPRAGWVAVTDGEYPAGTVTEPPVYVTFPPSHLSDSMLRTRTESMGENSSYAWLDEAILGFAQTAVNDVPDSVVELIDYTGDYEPWLFDRTATLFGVYGRTGDVKWLRHAHRSAQFYLGHVSDRGYFDLKADEDLKYSYGRSLLMDFIFTGDPALIDAIDRIAGAGEEWDPTYDLGTNFWTERHQTYALLAAVSAWEATGAARHSDRANEVVDVSFALANSPAAGWSDNDCMLHTMVAHEGGGGEVPVCSPWMSGLFADAVWEYYVHSADQDALTFLSGLGHFVADYGVYPGGESLDFVMPYYLASSETQFSDDGPWGDIEHTCDVGGLVARAAWADRQLGEDSSELVALQGQLMEGCQYILNSWHRPGGPAVGKSEWRLSPARKFNWWFGTTSDMSWLLRAE